MRTSERISNGSESKLSIVRGQGDGHRTKEYFFNPREMRKGENMDLLKAASVKGIAVLINVAAGAHERSALAEGKKRQGENLATHHEWHSCQGYIVA